MDGSSFDDLCRPGDEREHVSLVVHTLIGRFLEAYDSWLFDADEGNLHA